MANIFPIDPIIGQKETVLGTTFSWNGTGWVPLDTIPADRVQLSPEGGADSYPFIDSFHENPVTDQRGFNTTLLGVTQNLHQKFVLRKLVYIDQNAEGNGDGTSWDNAYTDVKTAFDNNRSEYAVTFLISEGIYSIVEGLGEFNGNDIEIIGGCVSKGSVLPKGPSYTTFYQDRDAVDRTQEDTDKINTSFAQFVNMSNLIIRNIVLNNFLVDSPKRLLSIVNSRNCEISDFKVIGCEYSLGRSLIIIGAEDVGSYKNELSNITVTDCIVPSGGDSSVFAFEGVSVSLTGFLGTGNSTSYGVILANRNSEVSIHKSYLENNSGDWIIYATGQADVLITRSVVKDNYGGYGIYNSSVGAVLNVFNSLFSNNTMKKGYALFLSNTTGGKIHVSSSTLICTRTLYTSVQGLGEFLFSNCIIDTQLGVARDIYKHLGTINNSFMNEPWDGAGTNNSFEDPKFIDRDTGNFKLRQGSPAIGYGILSEEEKYFYYMSPAINRDLQDHFRLGDLGNFSNVIDAGCYSYVDNSYIISDVPNPVNPGDAVNLRSLEAIGTTLSALPYVPDGGVLDGDLLSINIHRSEKVNMAVGEGVTYQAMDFTIDPTLEFMEVRYKLLIDNSSNSLPCNLEFLGNWDFALGNRPKGIAAGSVGMLVLETEGLDRVMAYYTPKE